MEIKIPMKARFIIKVIESHGHEAFVVGGCVRDSILGREPHDWDICTSARPEKLLQIFSGEKGYKVIPTGLQHGTISIVISGEVFEVTTYRIDGTYSDNRRPDSVEFTNDLYEDLKRRDFTINAMAYNSRSGLIDPFHGLEDINKRIIRCVGSAKERFNEDALRMLRALRFACQLRFSIDNLTAREIDVQFKSLKNISKERINSELNKIVASSEFPYKLIRFEHVFSFIIPGLSDLVDFEQNNPYHDFDVFNHTVQALVACSSDDLIVRLAVFLHDFGKPHSFQDGKDGIRHFKEHARIGADIADSLLRELRYDNTTRENVVELIKYHDATFIPERKAVKRWLNKLGEVQFRRLLELRKADIMGQKLSYDRKRVSEIGYIEYLIDEVLSDKSDNCFSLKNLMVNGNDIKEALQLKEGKEVGYWLNEILVHIMDGDLKNTKEDIISWVQERR